MQTHLHTQDDGQVHTEMHPHTACRLTHMLITADCNWSGMQCWTVIRMSTHILITTLQLQPHQKKPSTEHFSYCFSLLVHFSSRNLLALHNLKYALLFVLTFFPWLLVAFIIWTKGHSKAESKKCFQLNFNYYLTLIPDLSSELLCSSLCN